MINPDLPVFRKDNGAEMTPRREWYRPRRGFEFFIETEKNIYGYRNTYEVSLKTGKAYGEKLFFENRPYPTQRSLGLVD